MSLRSWIFAWAWGVISSLPRRFGICAVVRGTSPFAVAAFSGMLKVEPFGGFESGIWVPFPGSKPGCPPPQLWGVRGFRSLAVLPRGRGGCLEPLRALRARVLSPAHSLALCVF